MDERKKSSMEKDDLKSEKKRIGGEIKPQWNKVNNRMVERKKVQYGKGKKTKWRIETKLKKL